MKLIHPPEPNEDLFYRLLAILDYCYTPTKAIKRGFNDTAIARALDINRATVMKMREAVPKWGWWPTVIKDAITYVLPYIPRYKRRHVASMMRGLPEEIVEQIESACAAKDYLIDQLKEGPALSSELLSTANRGDLSEARIKKAAKALGIVKIREGKGKNHAATWSLPRFDDLF